ncbi:MAG: fatty acid--CoA ligase family protein [Acidimicrobiia bacterium]|nr:fatty acid--CoA ligase family protein [Acidimicrobiia bacterium]
MRGDLQWGTTANLVRAAAERFGALEALVDGEQRLSFTELAAAVHDAGRAFLAAGLEPGDRVAIWSPNVWEWVVALLGLQSAGGVVVPINTRYKGAEAAYVLQRSRARLLITVQGFLGNDYLTMLADQDLPDLEHTVVLRGDAPAGTTTWAGFLASGAAVDPSALDERMAALGPDSVADILFTSGTTGQPKGVVGTHGQVLRGFADWAAVIGLRAGDRYLVINPFFHAFGYKAGIVAALTAGATLVPQAVFDIPTAMAMVATHGITMLPGPPAIYQTFLNHPDLDLTQMQTLRLAVTGAAAVPVELVERMKQELGFEVVVTGYGLTEVSGIATMCRHDDDALTISTTSGRAIPGVDVRVVDLTGRELPRGEAGEVVVRGYNVMRGYFEDPVQTAEVIDADGWLHTGDIGVMDDRGYLAITDRMKDMFITGGFNVYPAEVERLLLLHPDIAQTAVIGLADERMGEVGMAFVVATAGTNPTPEAIIAWARQEMANFKVPRQVRIVPDLPMNASNKVLKTELRRQA